MFLGKKREAYGGSPWEGHQAPGKNMSAIPGHPQAYVGEGEDPRLHSLVGAHHHR